MSPKVIKSDDSDSSSYASSESHTEPSDEEYEVEQLVGKRVIRGVLQYKVRWVGYLPSEDTWESVKNLSCPAKIKDYERELEKEKAASAARKPRSRTRTVSRSSEYMDTSHENSMPTSKGAKRKKSASPSRVVKAKPPAPAPSSSNPKKAAKETTSKNAPAKASGGHRTEKTTANPLPTSSSPLTNLPSTSKEKSGTSTLFDKNPSGAREGMTQGQREFYESSADLAFIQSDYQNSVFNNLVTKIEPSANNENPAPSTLVKISEILSKNPPILSDEVSELANSILSKNTPSSYIDTVNASDTATTSKSHKTANKTGGSTDKRPTKSAAGSTVKTTNASSDKKKTATPSMNSTTAKSVTPTIVSPVIVDETSNATPLIASTTNRVVTPTIPTVADETTVTASEPPASTSDGRTVISPQPINTEKENENDKGRKDISMEKGAVDDAAAAAPVTKNKKSTPKEKENVHNRLWNMATTNSNEASIGIVEGRPLNIAEFDDAPVEPVIPDIPADHKCFKNSPTIFEFAKNAVIHSVNSQKMENVYSKLWKIRCTECTEKYIVNDSTVEYTYCLLAINDSKYFMIKLNKCNEELFLINAEKFRTICPKSYGLYVCITREYFDTLGDLFLAIDRQKDVVHDCFDNPILQPYKIGGSVDFAILESCPVEVMKAVREIGRLFFLELQMAIGKYMCTVVEVSELHKFVMDFYENRGQMFQIVRKDAVENIYETLFMTLISEPADL